MSSVSFLYAVLLIFLASVCRANRVTIMLPHPRHEERLERIAARLHSAEATNSALLAEFIAQACIRIASATPAAKARLDRLIEAAAWTNAALALLELELPAWTLRRLVREDGEWFCSLSQHPCLPLGLDDLAVASHQCLPLAILLALVEARSAAGESVRSPRTVPNVGPGSAYQVCCDNFR